MDEQQGPADRLALLKAFTHIEQESGGTVLYAQSDRDAMIAWLDANREQYTADLTDHVNALKRKIDAALMFGPATIIDIS